jgi:nicotinate-nucleotide adenylyltransferase
MTIIYGGSFNPPTLAHLNIIKKLLDNFKESKLLLLPVGDDYQKKDLASFDDRYKMLKLLIKDLKKVEILDNESKRSYKGTLYSLNEIKKQYNDDLYFVMGADQLIDFKSWIEYKKLLKEYPFIIMNRKNSLSVKETEELFKDYEHHFYYLEFDYNISSSKIRKDIEKNKKYLSDEIYRYIIENNLYKETSNV